tara:strand:+ start:1592 stop:1786 length:195 start_codon:yes stop_codon:yes gene_type:complete
MNQDTLDGLHRATRELVQLWADHLITDMELIAFMTASHTGLDGADPAGLLDPNTGLRYPTKQGA